MMKRKQDISLNVNMGSILSTHRNLFGLAEIFSYVNPAGSNNASTKGMNYLFPVSKYCKPACHLVEIELNGMM